MQLKYLFTVILLTCFSCVLAQEKKDSIYTKIEEFSDKRKVTKFLHRFIFRREADSVSVKTDTKEKNTTQFNGKFIRHIEIETVDPFGYTISNKNKDTKWYDRLAEKIHIDSRKSTIRNYLFFKEGEEFNSQKLYESERMLRSVNFINRVNINVSESEDSKDSLDVHVKILDSWSLKPRMSFSGSKIGLGITEENLLGLGHELNFYYTNNFKEKKNNFFGSYTTNNLFGTFINATILGEKDFENNERVSFSARRDFFSPLTRWAGGFTFDYFKRKVGLPILNASNIPEVQIKVFSQDLWGGYQFPVFISNDGKISRNIAVLGRFQNYQYKDKPEIDGGDFFHSTNSFLASAVFTDRKFSVEKNIFQYNLPEDIPYGKSFGLTGGFLARSNQAIPYGGVSASIGDFNILGYFNLKAHYGIFFSNEKDRQNEFRLDGTYFTPLHDWKFAKVRHFFSPTFAIGNWRYQYSYKDRMNLSGGDEFPMYNGDYIGTKKFILRYQLQLFINKSWKNFHFSPYLNATLGWLSQNGDPLFKSKTETKFGIGALIDNPHLVFNRIKVSFVYYPKLPIDSKPRFEFNSFGNDRMPLSSFGTEVPQFVNFGN